MISWAGKKRVGLPMGVERVIARQLEALTELPWTVCLYALNISTLHPGKPKVS